MKNVVHFIVQFLRERNAHLMPLTFDFDLMKKLKHISTTKNNSENILKFIKLILCKNS